MEEGNPIGLQSAIPCISGASKANHFLLNQPTPTTLIVVIHNCVKSVCCGVPGTVPYLALPYLFELADQKAFPPHPHPHS